MLNMCCAITEKIILHFLTGITSKLEYLKELGIGATWLSPIFKSPMYDFGYDISDFYDIQDEYGTMEDFENLLAKAKELGMNYKNVRIILKIINSYEKFGIYR